MQADDSKPESSQKDMIPRVIPLFAGSSYREAVTFYRPFITRIKILA
jgi:hypothetical protein